MVLFQSLLLASLFCLVTSRSIVSAAENVEGNTTEAEKLQLTESVLKNPTAVSLDSISLFHFASSAESKPRNSSKCKVFPGDSAWPSKSVWDTFNALSGGALIETVPIGAVCYKNHVAYNATACEGVLAGWSDDVIQ